MFDTGAPGSLVPISGVDPNRGEWTHIAFQPDPSPRVSPVLSGGTYRKVADARASLAALDSTARQLPNPRLLRQPTLRWEAQSRSALEGTYEPLAKVLTVGEESLDDPSMREVFNYVVMAEHAFAWVEESRRLTLPMICDLQSSLMAGTAAGRPTSGQVRPIQVVMGRRAGAPVEQMPIQAAPFIPMPPGPDLEARLRDLLGWMAADHSSELDPVVVAAMAHYQFESLHPFHDGNGRIGRLLIDLHLYRSGTLTEPTLTVSPWFEQRREAYYDRLFDVSTTGLGDGWVAFSATGIEESARATHRQVLALVDAPALLRERVRRSKLRADTAHTLVDYAVAHPTFTVRQVERDLNLSYGRANSLVTSLVELDVLAPLNDEVYHRRFYASEALRILIQEPDHGG